MTSSARTPRVGIPGGSRRRGYVAVLLAVIVFLMFAVAAFVFDLGLTKVIHRNMQTATDSAALEGLRFRDSPADERAAASLLVRQTFDDDFDFADDALNMGAGPVIDIVPDGSPTTDFAARLNGYSVYDPVLLPNDGTVNAPADRPEGDMLAGTYVSSARHDEGYSPVNPYVRDDFVTGPGFDDSFLVRIRRTSDLSVPDYNNIPGVSSSGPGLQLLMGRAAGISPTGAGAYNPTVDGLSFRATSIANAEHVLSAGPATTSSIAPPSGLDGAAHYGLSLEFWNALPVNVWQPAQVTAAGEVTEGALTVTVRDGQFIRRTEVDVAGLGGLVTDTTLEVAFSAGFPAPPFKARIDDEVLLVTAVDGVGNEWTVVRGQYGSAIVPHAAASLVHLYESAMITDPLLSTVAVDNGFGPSLSPDFVPVFAAVAGTERIVGFGGAMIRPAPAQTIPPPAYPVDVEIMRLDSFVPPRNAMAHLARPVDPAIAAADVEASFLARHSIAGPLVAPALVRSYGD